MAQQIDASEVPTGLRQFLNFTRLPARALASTRRALDEDEAFRERVRSVVDERAVGEAGWLLLDRPEGWESSLRGLVDAAEDEEAESNASAELRRARREIDNVRAALERAEADAATTREALERGRSELAEHRAARRRAEDDAAGLARRLDQVEAARTRAVRELEAARAQVADRANALREADRRLRAAEERATQAASRLRPGDPRPASATTAEPGERRVPSAPLDVRGLADQIGRASSAAEGLANALAAASRLLAVEVDQPPPPAPAAARPSRRHPAALPVGVLDDSPEAARHLFGLKGMTVLVDGYNVSMRGWSELPLALQRDRLVDALASLAARTGVRPVVVFDASERVAAPPFDRGRAVQVRFAPPGIEADDVIIDAVGDYPLSSPVTVVSNDERVRDGARRKGANVVATDQLLGLL